MCRTLNGVLGTYLCQPEFKIYHSKYLIMSKQTLGIFD